MSDTLQERVIGRLPDDHYTPRQAADVWAAEAFDPPRTVAHIEGHWCYPRWCGSFTLTGGVRTYWLNYDHASGYWVVSVAE